MKRFVNVLPMVAVTFLMCISAHNASAQQEVKHRSYLYCSILFGGDKMVVEETIGNYTRESKEWRDILKDSDGNKRFFNSQIAALNWLGMHGWELVTLDNSMINGTTTDGKLYLRLDVTGLTYEEINEQLSIFGNMKHQM